MTKARLKQIIREELQVVLTNEEAGEMFGDEVQEELEQEDKLEERDSKKPPMAQLTKNPKMFMKYYPDKAKQLVKQLNQRKLKKGSGYYNLANELSGLNESIDVSTLEKLEASVTPELANAVMIAYKEMTTPTDVDQVYANTGDPVSKDPQDMHDKAVEMIGEIIFDQSKKIPQDGMRINEDGHTDVPSAARKMKLAIEDAGQILQGLQAVDGELPAWWMSKITIASEYLNKARDYLLTPSQEMQEVKLSEPEKEEKEKIVKGMKKSKADFKKRYGKDAESVMYATATKIAKEKK